MNNNNNEEHIQPSECSVSNILGNLLCYSEEIDNRLLIGEQIELVNEASETYNELRGLVTPDYFTDVEYEWLIQLGTKWNDMVQDYRATMGDTLAPNSNDILSDLEDQLRNALDDFMDGRSSYDDDNPFGSGGGDTYSG